MRSRDWRIVLGATAGIITALALLVRQLVVGSIVESYSPGWHSPTSAVAEQKRLLITRVAIQPDSLLVNGEEVVPLEAWVEPATHIEYRFFFFPHTVRDSQNLLIVHLKYSPDQTPYTGASEDLAYGDSIVFDEYEGNYVIAGVE